MEKTREIFDGLVAMYVDQQVAYNCIEEMFGTTGDISNIIDNTMARLEDVIMLTLGWHVETKIYNDLGCEGDVWVKEDKNISSDNLSDWFSIYNHSSEFTDRMEIIFKMSMGDEEAMEQFEKMMEL